MKNVTKNLKVNNKIKAGMFNEIWIITKIEEKENTRILTVVSEDNLITSIIDESILTNKNLIK